jgi:hypothetical protein
VITLDQRVAFVDADARRAYNAMNHDVRAALYGVPHPIQMEAGDAAMDAYVTSLTEGSEANWRRFFIEIKRALGMAACAGDEHRRVAEARVRLQAFLNENCDLGA